MIFYHLEITTYFLFLEMKFYNLEKTFFKTSLKRFHMKVKNHRSLMRLKFLEKHQNPYHYNNIYL